MILLLASAALADTWSVGTSAEWTDALASAVTGDVIEIDPAIEPSALTPAVTDTKLTIRSATSDVAPIPALYVKNGVLTLENVQLVELAASTGYLWASQAASVPCSHQPGACGLYVSSGTTLVADGLVLIDLSLEGDALSIHGADVSLTNLKVEGVDAANVIGAVYPNDARSFQCQSCFFDDSAGMSFFDEGRASSVILTDLHFQDSPDTSAVVAPIYASGLVELQVNTARFERVGGSTGGLVVTQDVAYTTVTGSADDVTADFYAAVTVFGGALTLRDLDVFGVTGSYGGVAYVSSGELTMERVRAEQVNAATGALAYTSGSPVTGQDLEVINATVSDPNGAVLHLTTSSAATLKRARVCDATGYAMVNFSGNQLELHRGVVQGAGLETAVNMEGANLVLRHSTLDGALDAVVRGKVNSLLDAQSNVMHGVQTGLDLSQAPSDTPVLDYNLWSQVDFEQAAGLGMTQGANSVRAAPEWHTEYAASDCGTWPLVRWNSPAQGAGQPDGYLLEDMGAFNEPGDFHWYAWTPTFPDTAVDTGDTDAETGDPDDTGVPAASVPNLLGGCGQVGPWGALIALGAGLALRRRPRPGVTLSP